MAPETVPPSEPDPVTVTAAGWLDPPNPAHSCHAEMPGPLTREDWQRRWRCSCGKVYRVQDSQREGFYFAAVLEHVRAEVPDGT